jgi:transglutaminase-like putative cysteine protease
MPIRVALHHRTVYHYDRLVTLSPQTIRLRPAPHCRTPIAAYSLKVEPKPHFLNWQQDPQSNFLARVVFPQPVRHFSVDVDLIAEMTVINPFDFFLEPYAEKYPFCYEPTLERELAPFRQVPPAGPLLAAYLKTVNLSERRSIDFFVDLNQQLQHKVRYLIRMEPGVQSSEQTLTLDSGSCRDSAWLLVEILRHLGLAARFVSGYLIQLKPDLKPLEGQPGPGADFTDLHAWTEVYLPGAGWVGLDPTSGLFAGEGHIPLAATPESSSAAPISGGVDECEVTFTHEMSVSRIHEDPRVTLPYTDAQWQSIHALGCRIDQDICARDIRLTMGGEPTFVSIDNMDGAEWNTAALGPEKRKLAERLLDRLRKRSLPAAYCITARANGIRASRCRAGPSPATGAPMAFRCGTIARYLPRNSSAPTSVRSKRGTSPKRWRSDWGSVPSTSAPHSKILFTICKKSANCPSMSIRWTTG